MGFDDSAWGEAQIVRAMMSGLYRAQPPTHPYGPLYPRSIGRLAGEVRKPASVQVETISSLTIPPGVSPMDRVDQALAAPRTGRSQEHRLPVRVDVPDRGAVWIKIDMGRTSPGLVEFSLQAEPGAEFDLSYLEEPIRRDLAFWPDAGRDTLHRPR